MLVEDVFHVEDWAGYFIQLNLPLPVNENLSAPLYKIIPFFRTTNYFSSAHKIKWSEHSVGCDTLHVFFINPLIKIWSIGDAGVVNLVLIGEINARMILYNFCELVTSHAVVKTSKNTKHVYKINFATAVNICRHISNTAVMKQRPCFSYKSIWHLSSTIENILSTSVQREIGISCIGLHKSRYHYTALWGRYAICLFVIHKKWFELIIHLLSTH